MNKQTVIINLLGAPGTGKTTTAMEIFVEMKKLGLSVEFLSEFAKEALYEDREKVFENELYMFAKKQHKMFVLDGQVDYVVTDAPLILTKVFNQYYNPNSNIALNNLIDEEHNKFLNINILLDSDLNYKQEGRRESEEEAKELHLLIAEEMVNLSGTNLTYKPKDQTILDMSMDDLVDFIVIESIKMRKKLE